jgi:acetolactate synthase I/II/III large subunit
MKGAEALLRTLVGAGVDTCFANPGTSEMHFVAALDSVPGMRSVLCLFEGVATGAADGFGRMAERPALTLLHLGPGLGNGLANLHNARKARTPVVNVVGDHATYHKRFDTPLESDIETVARNVSPWVRRSLRTEELGADAAEAVQVACGPPGQIATLIVAADVSWNDGGQIAPAPPHAARSGPTPESVDAIARALRRGEPSALFLGGAALRRPALLAADRIARAIGARLICETFPARIERGLGLPPLERLAYFAEFAVAQLEGLRHLVLVDAKAPIAFFAYPGLPSELAPPDSIIHTLARESEDSLVGLEALAEALGAPRGKGDSANAERTTRPSGPLTAESACQAVCAVLPEGAIVADEGNTSTGLFAFPMSAGAAPCNWLTLTGGAIGQGLPVATGAALASRGRKVIALEADGSALYTVQALWTQARENLDVVNVILNNRSYAVLNIELQRVGAGAPGSKALEMLDLRRPDIDFVLLAKGFGVPASRATTADELVQQLEHALQSPGPTLIEAVLPSLP